jgi:hypothetical protein
VPHAERHPAIGMARVCQKMLYVKTGLDVLYQSSHRGAVPFGGGVTHGISRQKWHASYLRSQRVQRGVSCPSAYTPAGSLSLATQYSQKQPVNSPQSTHGRQRSSAVPNAETVGLIAPI